MAVFKVTCFALVAMTLVYSATLCVAHPVGFNFGWGWGSPGGNGGQGGNSGNGGGGSTGLSPEHYQFSCPQANDIVMSVLHKAIANNPRVAASLLRLHFHDCFVQVSILVDHVHYICFGSSSSTACYSVILDHIL